MMAVPAHSQSWSMILDSSRAADWTSAGIPGGIPTRKTVCANVHASHDPTGSVDMANINNAIAGCAANQVIQLDADTYYISHGLTFGKTNNVTLRGAGPDKTTLKFIGVGKQECGGYGSICLWGNNGSPTGPASYAGSHSWKGTTSVGVYSPGATILTLDSVSGLSPGQIIVLDQRNDDIGLLNSPNGITENGCTTAPCTVTATTSIPHKYAVGQMVGVGGNRLGTNYTPGPYAGWQTVTAVWDTVHNVWNSTANFSDPASTRFRYIINTANVPDGGSVENNNAFTTADPGGVIVSGNRHVTISENLDVGRHCPDKENPPTCQASEISWRSTMEVKVVTAVDAVNHRITIFPGIYYPNWRTSQAPGVYWLATTNVLTTPPTGNYAIRDGIEDLTADYSNNGGTDNYAGIELRRAYQCWVKNVRSINGDRNHVWIRDGSMQNEVVDSYFVGQKGAASQSYGVEMHGATANNLIQNNMCQHIVACIMTGGSVASVISYNYLADDGYYVPGWMTMMSNANHDVSAFNLFEGNDTPGVIVDNVHGTSNLSTFFRNRMRGQSNPAKNNNLIGTIISAYNRGMNYVGNVMGTAGFQAHYEELGFPQNSGYIWALDKTSGYNTGVPDDPLVHQSLLRWGNYDVATGAVRWCGNSSSPGWSTLCHSTSEMPTSGMKIIQGNPVPLSTTLPASFYLPAQPYFWSTPWGTPHWPAIGPDVQGGTALDGLNGHSFPIPAQLCYTNTPLDHSFQKTFTVTGASWSARKVTLNIGSSTLAANDTVIVSGAAPSGYNGKYQVTSKTSATISYALPTDPGTYRSGGTVSYPNILLFNAANCYPAASTGPVPSPVPAPPGRLNTSVR